MLSNQESGIVMHVHTLRLLKHNHDFAVINKKGERRTRIVLILTFLTMVLEITADILFGSMVLLADGYACCCFHDYTFCLSLFSHSYT